MPAYDMSVFYETYGDLLPIAQGYADALLECQGNCAIGDEWHGLGPDDFSKGALRKIYLDCEKFFRAAIELHPDGEDGLMLEIDDYDLGFNFYLDRQGTGVGFRDRHLDELGDRLEQCAAGFGWIEVEITPDRKIDFLSPAPIAAQHPTN